MKPSKPCVITGLPRGQAKGETDMIMTRTKKGYSITASEKEGRELVMEMLRASCQVIQDLSFEYDIAYEKVIQDIVSELKNNSDKVEATIN